MKSAMKVFQINYSYPPSFSGCGRQLATVNRAYQALFNDSITVLTAYKVPKGLYKEEVVSVFNKHRPVSRLQTILYYIFCVLIPVYVIRKRSEIDLIHVVSAGPEALFAWLSAAVIRKPLVVKVTLNEVGKHLANPTLLSKAKFFLLKKGVVFVAISDKIKKELIEVGVKEKNIKRINNSVDFSAITLRPIAEGLNPLGKCGDSSHVKLVFVGVICERKGVLDLLEAARLVVEPNQVSLKLAGPIEMDLKLLDSKLQNLKRKNNISVTLLGKVDNPIPYIHEADYLILPSHSEGMPNVVLEALATGTPVIASSIAVHKEMIDSNNGILHAVGDPGALCVAIENARYREWDEEKIRNRTKMTYSSEVISTQYMMLYKELTKF